MKHLVKVTEQYRLENEAQAEAFLQEEKRSDKFEVVSYKSEKKATKSKGEVIDEWVRLTIVKAFNDEKEPVSDVSINYEVN